MNLLVADQRITRGRPGTLTWQYVDENGRAADPGTVTVGIAKADGSTLVAGGAATSGTGSDPRTYVLSAVNNLTLELLTVTWTIVTGSVPFTTLVEVAGGFYFTLVEIRTSDSTLADEAKYPDDDLIRCRKEVEDECEMICDVAFVPRYRRVFVDGSGTSDLILYDNQLRTVRTVRTYSSASSYTTFTTGELADLWLEDDLTIHRPVNVVFDDSRRNGIVIEYEHGYNAPPSDLKRATLTRLRHRLNWARTGIPDRATSFTSAEGGTYRLDTPGAYKTGIPEVDAVYARYSRRDSGADGGPRPSSRSIDLNPQRFSVFHGSRR